MELQGKNQDRQDGYSAGAGSDVRAAAALTGVQSGTMAERFIALYAAWEDQPYRPYEAQVVAEPDMWPFIHARDQAITGLTLFDAQPAGEPRLLRQCDVILFCDGSSVLRRYEDYRPLAWAAIAKAGAQP